MGNFWPAASDCGGLHIDILFEGVATMTKNAEAANPRPEIQPRLTKIHDGGPDGRRQAVPRCDSSLRSASSSRPISGRQPGVML